ncbi:MAG: hypothetical protein LRY41_01830 [Candidatus Pacebacteria bacterium]|nr:hypothetical protein [Candidatus Paceibacterota bacterium]MCD8508325.1 hypothetical protein [Candidatus Paceibacterota bacterium]MCD8528050.1 hypothetical protein [Candidatus Paceibacterota bacterium]MCD8564062.1 hypothetical protein [Candidatus Paceibacterota bacterium]
MNTAHLFKVLRVENELFFTQKYLQSSQEELAKFLIEEDVTIQQAIQQIDAEDKTGKNEVIAKILILTGGIEDYSSNPLNQSVIDACHQILPSQMTGYEVLNLHPKNKKMWENIFINKEIELLAENK